MRLWSLHPKYVDVKGLVALWRETLLAQAVLAGQTKGYQHHPQLNRFKEMPDPIGSIGAYLAVVAEEAMRRGYRFDSTKILRPTPDRLQVTIGQLAYEWEHLKRKLFTRDPSRYAEYQSIDRPDPHPLFDVIPGEIAEWERGSG